MFMLLRYLILFLQRPWRRRHPPLKVIEASYQVMPWDCDLNFHLTNAKYPALLDLTRVRYFLAIGMMPLVAKQKWGVVVSSQTITYIREIKPFKKMTTEVKVIHWDRKYLYTEDRFLVDGKIHAKALTRLAFLKSGRVASFSRLLKEIDAYHGSDQQDWQSPPVERQTLAKIELLDAQRAAETH
jgi:acyl-CoA thioesterase FadM